MALGVLEFVELILRPCQHVYGASPCTAVLGVSGSCKCYNSPATCQDTANFLAGEQVVRWAVPTADLPVDYDYIPSLKSVAVRAQKISPGESLGTRESVTASFVNHRHNDSGFDNYLADRDFNPFNLGTFWGKFVARWPNIQGFEFRYVKGHVGQNINDMERRYYNVESTSGPDSSGGFSITAKDAIKFFDSEKAVVPLPSPGVLEFDISSSGMAITLSPAGIGDLRYPVSGIASMGDEKVSFTRVGDAITLIERHMNGSTNDEHKAGETFQLGVGFYGENPANIIYALISGYTDTPAEYLDLPAWLAEITTHIGRLYTGEIMKPTGVKKIIDELIQEVGLVMHTDTKNKKISVKALRNLIPVASFNDDLVRGDSLTTRFDSDKRISQVITYYAQKNPLEKKDDAKNYFAIINTFSGDPVSALEGASQSIKTIYSRWISVFNRPAAESINNYLLQRYGRAPKSVAFKLPYFAALELGSVFTLASNKFEDSQGNQLPPVSFQAVSVELDKTGSTVLGEEIINKAPPPDDGIFVINIDVDSYNLNLRDVFDSIYSAPESGDQIEVYLASGVVIGSVSTSLFALTIGDWPAGVVITIYRLGTTGAIAGAGGNGDSPGFPGSPGGPALFTRFAITLVDCLVGGGGGGGGSSVFDYDYGAVGGGGAGRVPGNGYESGNLLTGGAGEINGPSVAGAGGDLGEDGETVGFGMDGGAAGVAIDGVSYVTFSGSSDIRGDQIN